jgi:hypothetical protein
MGALFCCTCPAFHHWPTSSLLQSATAMFKIIAIMIREFDLACSIQGLSI